MGNSASLFATQTLQVLRPSIISHHFFPPCLSIFHRDTLVLRLAQPGSRPNKSHEEMLVLLFPYCTELLKGENPPGDPPKKVAPESLKLDSILMCEKRGTPIFLLPPRRLFSLSGASEHRLAIICKDRETATQSLGEAFLWP